MVIGAGNINKRIEIQGKTSSHNGYEVVESFGTKATVWAAVSYLSDTERFRAGAAQRSAQVRFTIRKIEVLHSDQIKFDGFDYAIDGIKPVQGQPHFIEITAGLI